MKKHDYEASIGFFMVGLMLGFACFVAFVRWSSLIYGSQPRWGPPSFNCGHFVLLVIVVLSFATLFLAIVRFRSLPTGEEEE